MTKMTQVATRKMVTVYLVSMFKKSSYRSVIATKILYTYGTPPWGSLHLPKIG